MRNNIRALRKAQGVSSDQLAAKIGASGATIRRLEAGGRQLTQIWMVKVAGGLRCDPADLIADREATPVNGVPMPQNRTKAIATSPQQHSVELLAKGMKIARAAWEASGAEAEAREAATWIELLETDAVMIEMLEAIVDRRQRWNGS